jgi:hypothetical protein
MYLGYFVKPFKECNTETKGPRLDTILACEQESLSDWAEVENEGKYARKRQSIIDIDKPDIETATRQ